jgi:hypothetical protein
MLGWKAFTKEALNICSHSHQWLTVQATVLLIKDLNISNNLLPYTEELKDLQCQDIQVDNQGIHPQPQITTLLFLEPK